MLAKRTMFSYNYDSADTCLIVGRRASVFDIQFTEEPTEPARWCARPFTCVAIFVDVTGPALHDVLARLFQDNADVGLLTIKPVRLCSDMAVSSKVTAGAYGPRRVDVLAIS